MSDERGRERERDSGQALPLLVLVTALAGVLALGVGRLGALVAERAAAQTAADAVALAAVSGGASSVAAANGASIVSVDWLPGGDVRVVVERRGSGERAAARARAGDMKAGVVAPAMRAALARAEGLLGGRAVAVTAVSDGGLTIAVPVDVAAELARVGADAGLCPAVAAASVPMPAGGQRFTVCPPPARIQVEAPG